MSPTSCQTAPPRARRDKDYSEHGEGVSTKPDEKNRARAANRCRLSHDKRLGTSSIAMHAGKFPSQSAVAPLARITLDHFSDSALIQRENSSGELPTTSKPWRPSASRVCG